MANSPYYLEPNFMPDTNIKSCDNHQSPIIENKQNNKSFVDTIKENKLLILVFAVIIILLIAVIVWMVFKNDEDTLTKHSKLIPNTIEHSKIEPTNTIEPSKIEPTNTNQYKPPMENINKEMAPKSIIAKKFIDTIDDEEVNKFVNAPDSLESSEESDEESNDESSDENASKNINVDPDFTDIDELTNLDNYTD